MIRSGQPAALSGGLACHAALSGFLRRLGFGAALAFAAIFWDGCRGVAQPGLGQVTVASWGCFQSFPGGLPRCWPCSMLLILLSGLLVLFLRGVGWFMPVRDRAFLPGPPGIWHSEWFQIPAVAMCVGDISFWSYFWSFG